MFPTLLTILSRARQGAASAAAPAWLAHEAPRPPKVALCTLDKEPGSYTIKGFEFVNHCYLPSGGTDQPYVKAPDQLIKPMELSLLNVEGTDEPHAIGVPRMPETWPFNYRDDPRECYSQARNCARWVNGIVADVIFIASHGMLGCAK